MCAHTHGHRCSSSEGSCIQRTDVIMTLPWPLQVYVPLFYSAPQGFLHPLLLLLFVDFSFFAILFWCLNADIDLSILLILEQHFLFICDLGWFKKCPCQLIFKSEYFMKNMARANMLYYNNKKKILHSSCIQVVVIWRILMLFQRKKMLIFYIPGNREGIK